MSDVHFSFYMEKFECFAKDENLVSFPKKKFLLLRPCEVKEIIMLAKNKGKDYNELEKKRNEKVIAGDL